MDEIKNFEGNSRTSPFRVELFMLRNQKLGNEIQCINEKTKKMEKKKKKMEEEEKHKKNELPRKTPVGDPILRRRRVFNTERFNRDVIQ